MSQAETPSSPFHAGERAAQALAGVSLQHAPIRDYMPDQHRTFFEALAYAIVATVDEAGWPVATMLTGAPGFVSSPDPRTLTVTTAALDARDPTAGHLVPGAPVGILGIDLATRRRNRANGRIRTRDAGTFTVAVEQSFGNCAKYIQARELAARLEASPAAAPPEVLETLDADAAELVRRADTFFVASNSGAVVTGGAGMDISHRGGRPGFVRVEGDVLTIPDFRGNRYFNTLGNLLLEPRVGLLFADFGSGDLLHLGGRAEVLWDPEAGRGFAGAERLWRVRVTRGWRRRSALALRWLFREFAPTTELTGTWSASGAP